MKSRLLILSIALLALIVRSVGLSTQSLTMDECLEIETALMPWQDILGHPNSFPPLYHLVLKAWLAFETSAIGVRTLSVLIGIVAVAAIGVLTWSAVDARAGWIAATLTAASPFHVYYSQEGRGYILFLFLGILAGGIGLELLRQPKASDRFWFVLVSVLGGYTHYYFALWLIAIGLGILMAKGWKHFLREVIPLAAIIGILCGPLLLIVQDDLNYQRDLRESRPASLAAIGYTLFAFESGYSLGPSRSELHGMKTTDAIQEAIFYAAPLGFAIAVLLVIGMKRIGRTDREVNYWLCLAVIPFIIVIVVCWVFGVTYNTRFLVCCWIPYVVLVAAGLSRLPNPKLALVALVLGCVYGLALYNRNFNTRYQNEDMQSVARFLESAEERPLLVCSGYMEGPLRHYVDQPITPLPDQTRGGSESIAVDWLEAFDQPAWFVYSRPFHGDPEGNILELLVGDEAELVHVAAGVRVYRIDP